jgi:hypothetical protein
MIIKNITQKEKSHIRKRDRGKKKVFLFLNQKSKSFMERNTHTHKKVEKINDIFFVVSLLLNL